jgi:hypothetical protein
MGADLANNFATAEAACLVRASLSASDEFQTLAAWTANVLASMGVGAFGYRHFLV